MGQKVPWNGLLTMHPMTGTVLSLAFGLQVFC